MGRGTDPIGGGGGPRHPKARATAVGEGAATGADSDAGGGPGRISVRVGEAEYLRLKTEAAAAREPISDYVRRRLFDPHLAAPLHARRALDLRAYAEFESHRDDLRLLLRYLRRTRGTFVADDIGAVQRIVIGQIELIERLLRSLEHPDERLDTLARVIEVLIARLDVLERALDNAGRMGGVARAVRRPGGRGGVADGEGAILARVEALERAAGVDAGRAAGGAAVPA